MFCYNGTIKRTEQHLFYDKKGSIIMGCNKYPHMFAPMTIKGVTFKNRVLASPITTNRIVDHG